MWMFGCAMPVTLPLQNHYTEWAWLRNFGILTSGLGSTFIYTLYCDMWHMLAVFSCLNYLGANNCDRNQIKWKENCCRLNWSAHLNFSVSCDCLVQSFRKTVCTLQCGRRIDRWSSMLFMSFLLMSSANVVTCGSKIKQYDIIISYGKLSSGLNQTDINWHWRCTVFWYKRPKQQRERLALQQDIQLHSNLSHTEQAVYLAFVVFREFKIFWPAAFAIC